MTTSAGSSRRVGLLGPEGLETGASRDAQGACECGSTSKKDLGCAYALQIHS